VKLKYIIGILVLLLLMVGTASAEPFYLTHINDPAFQNLEISIKVTYDESAQTITVEDESPAFVGVSNVDIKEIGLQLPAGVTVNDVTDDGASDWGWNPEPGSYQESEYGTFNTQLKKNTNSYKTSGPIVIELSSGIGTLSPSDIVVHISFGDEDDPDETLVGSGWVGIPEFPTVALPVAAILGLMFVFGRKKQE
jgi:hypothetical protein